MSTPDFRPLYPFESHFVEVEGGRMHYVDEGAGEPLLFVHGNPTWSFAFRNLIAAFKDRHRCVAVDHIGCGLSDKPKSAAYDLDFHIRNLNRLVEHLDLRNVTLVAHDWGGAIGVGAAARDSSRFRRFVLMNTAAFRSQRIPLRISVCRIPLLGRLGVQGLGLFSRAAMRMASTARLPDEVRAGYLHPHRTWSDRQAVYRFVKDIPLKVAHHSYRTLCEVEAGLRRLAQDDANRWQLIWGMRDWCFSPHFLDKFTEFLPHAGVLKLDNASHFVFEDEPEAVRIGIEKFLEAPPLPSAAESEARPEVPSDG